MAIARRLAAYAVRALIVAAAAAPALSGADAALIHYYDFATPGAVFDEVGTSNGLLLGGATVSGNALHLDGSSAYVQFADQLVPTGNATYSVLVRASGTPNPGTFTEIVSQGASGTGFYIGTRPGGEMRATDYFLSTGFTFPSGVHDYLFSSGPGGSRFYVDNFLVVNSPTQAAITSSGTATRFGRQFDIYAEYFAGDVSSVRVFDSVEVPAAVPEPAAWSLLIAGFAAVGAALRRRAARVLGVN